LGDNISKGFGVLFLGLTGISKSRYGSLYIPEDQDFYRDRAGICKTISSPLSVTVQTAVLMVDIVDVGAVVVVVAAAVQ
jgi:hypothetical protein